MFPSDKFKINIYPNDHEPPHFHVICEGWDVGIIIENGDLYRINKRGTRDTVYNYIVKNIKEWLESKNMSNKNTTNQDNIVSLWESFHENE